MASRPEKAKLDPVGECVLESLCESDSADIRSALATRGAAYFENRRTEREIGSLTRKAAELGMKLVPTS